MAVHSGGAGDDSEDDDDIILGVREDFRKHIDALKRACVLEVGHGGYISTPASILSGEIPPEEDEEEEEDDDELFQSIQRKYGSLLDGNLAWFEKGTALGKKLDMCVTEAEGEVEGEDDEEILRSVEQLYSGGGKGGQQALLLKVVSPMKDSSNTEIYQSPSPQASPGGAPGGGACAFSPQKIGKTGNKPAEEVGRSITSFLPGNWIDTDGDAEFGGASPAGQSEMVSIQQRNDSLIQTSAETSCLPKTVDTVADALKKNRQCQRTLRNVLIHIEAKQKENRELQRRVRTLVDFEKYCNRRFAGFFTDQVNPSVKLITTKAPALQNKSTETNEKTVIDLQTCGPPENSDVEIYKKLQQKVSLTFMGRRWSNQESSELAKGVKQQVYEVLVRQAMDSLSNLETLDEELDSLDDHMSKIGAKEFTAHEIKDAVPGINWAEVARLYVMGRTAEECQSRWMNHEDSLINKGPWTKMEDKKLLKIAQHHNCCNWEKIAQELGTNRTPAECLIRYQRSLNASIMRSNWTPEEDSQLRAAVEEWGENNWSSVAASLEGRNNSQCLMRWYKVLHPTKKKSGRWSVDEDKRLKWAVSVYGPKKWKGIAEHVPGRTDLQCRERWCNVLDPSIKLGEWTVEEDRNLEAALAKHGPHRWAAVANDLKIRTDNQCCRRWKFLHPEEQPAFERTVHIRRTALVKNFQGRSKERPRLGPQDFTSHDVASHDIEVLDKRKLPVQGMSVDESRIHRAARIEKRKLARASQGSNGRIQRSTLALAVPADNEFIQENDSCIIALNEKERDSAIVVWKEREKVRKRKAGPIADRDERDSAVVVWKEKEKVRKRKAGPIADQNESRKQTKRKVSTTKAGSNDDLIVSCQLIKKKGSKTKAAVNADPIEPCQLAKKKVSKMKAGPNADPNESCKQAQQKPRKTNAGPNDNPVEACKPTKQKVRKKAVPNADPNEICEPTKQKVTKKAGSNADPNELCEPTKQKVRKKAGPNADAIEFCEPTKQKVRKTKAGANEGPNDFSRPSKQKASKTKTGAIVDPNEFSKPSKQKASKTKAGANVDPNEFCKPTKQKVSKTKDGANVDPCEFSKPTKQKVSKTNAGPNVNPNEICKPTKQKVCKTKAGPNGDPNESGKRTKEKVSKTKAGLNVDPNEYCNGPKQKVVSKRRKTGPNGEANDSCKVTTQKVNRKRKARPNADVSEPSKRTKQNLAGGRSGEAPIPMSLAERPRNTLVN